MNNNGQPIECDPPVVCPTCEEMVFANEIVTCAECGRYCCLRCAQIIDDTGDDELNEHFACSDDCEVAWLEGLQASEEEAHIMYQDWIGKQIEKARTKAQSRT